MVKVTVKVVPRSGRRTCILDSSGVLKCYLTSPPEDGKANRELIKFLAQAWDLAQADITIAQGAIARKKLLYVRTNRTYEQLLVALGCEVQRALL